MTENFKDIFGVDAAAIKKTCILAPVVTKDLLKKLAIQDFTRSQLYACGSNDNTTVIHTLMGPSFVGDAVLHLASTPCQNLILFGSCGLVQKTPELDIGSIVTPYESYAMESFSDLLRQKKNEFDSSAADNDFLNKLLYCLRRENLLSVKCASFGSILLEAQHKTYLLQEHVQIMDMESSAFFFAAKHTDRKAIGLFYVTDILDDKPAFRPHSPQDNQTISRARAQAVDWLAQFSQYLEKESA
jgi:purine-nucleoside phosphorylase